MYVLNSLTSSLWNSDAAKFQCGSILLQTPRSVGNARENPAVGVSAQKLDGLPLGEEAPQFSCSPADTITSEPWTTDLASTRWLGLLATDAAQADSGFSLAPSPERDDPSVQHKPSFDAQALANGISAAPQFERAAWQSDVDATLTGHEAVLLRHFAERSSLWLDLFDPQRLFSTYAIRLALRNTGLMKAMLALSAKHRARSRDVCPGFDAHESATEAASAGGENEWIGYYYETLHYLSEALAYKSYTNSEELLATAITISAYEMLDESDGQGIWQRHLKGVFWIQRSQDVHGASGGLRQSVWWAWLRQDLWAAFRERRHCLSFWVPVQDYAELDQHAMANRAIYLLSQAVNYCADARGVDGSASTNDLSAAMKRRPTKEGLLADMARWKTFLGAGYKPLPSQAVSDDVFTPMWVHPPQFGVALQAYSFALILVTLHSPHPAGFDGYLKMQRTLSGCVDTICGIAMELGDEGCQIFSAQCLYGAGLCVQDSRKRDKILGLMEAAEQKVGWTPMATWRDDLRREWARVDKEHEHEHE
ncbi:uncharacterized protein J7T54_004548 [Emericellopsis cladophorae]|uniref:Uncharacterized protein n=1 Tax=Emericellopsis cladophorae TaxID=2686198 RepID=A0A9P9Y5R8_9HYPO|nr:uncharacterized protein J7T54_004548 [Emericellopsis cladophorae]KAI6784002.1 hypothetical protein J7T54_004548 [Emericellopsis cladophorae]